MTATERPPIVSMSRRSGTNLIASAILTTLTKTMKNNAASVAQYLQRGHVPCGRIHVAACQARSQERRSIIAHPSDVVSQHPRHFGPAQALDMSREGMQFSLVIQRQDGAKPTDASHLGQFAMKVRGGSSTCRCPQTLLLERGDPRRSRYAWTIQVDRSR